MGGHENYPLIKPAVSPQAVWLLRHGVSLMTGTGQWQGWADVGLSEEGKRQARACGKCSELPEVEEVRVSSLRRAVATASILRPRARIILDDRLRTRNLGKWEGWTTDEIMRDGGSWFSPFAPGRPPGGESLEAVTERVNEFLGDLCSVADTSHIVVTHGAVIGIILQLIGSEPVIIPPCSFITIVRSGDWWKLLSPPKDSVPPV
jgi:broad specificity phosphatase PhoE